MNSNGLPAAMSVNEFARWAGIGRTSAWAQIKDRQISAIKIGRRTLIPTVNAYEWLSKRPAAR